MAPRDNVRHALVQRVTRKVSGHGIARRSIEGAVDRVLAALPAIAPPAAQVAVFAAVSAPDLPSRARRTLDRHGAEVLAMGAGSSGRHTVVTVRLPATPTPVLERAAAELGASLTMLDSADAGRFDA